MTKKLSQPFNAASWCIDRSAERVPERIAVIDDRGPVRYSELRQRVNQVSHALGMLKCGVGARVLILLPDCVEFIAAFFGAVKTGAIAVPVSPLARVSDFVHYIADSGADVAFVHHAAAHTFAAANVHGRVKTIIVGSDGGGHDCWEELVAPQPVEINPHSTGSNDAAFLLYTSGSSGVPRAAVHAHGNMLAAYRGMASDIVGIDANDRTFAASKLFFAYALGNAMYFPLAAGATTILSADPPSMGTVAKVFRQFKPTLFFSIPSFYQHLLDSPSTSHHLDWSSIRCAFSAGEYLSPELFRSFRERFNIELLDNLGSTEMLQSFLSNRPGHARPGSCGKPVNGYDVRAVNDMGREVEPGEVGNLRVRGASAFCGYWNAPQLTELVFADDWFSTGDRVQVDQEGFYNFCGRAADTLKVSGMWVSPVEVEAIVQSHEDVEKAAVVGSHSGKLLAYVLLKDRDQKENRALWRHIRERLAQHMWPSEIIFVGRIPVTATGKVDRAALRLEDHLSRSSEMSPFDSRPESDTERLLAAIWAEILKTGAPPTRDDDFVELGGDSFAAMHCITAIDERWGVELPGAVLLAEDSKLSTVAAAIDRLLVLRRQRDGIQVNMTVSGME
jgi:benzoate-CoA ligase family protein